MRECWLSGEVALYHSCLSLSICHAAAGSRLLWSQLSAQLEIISLSLSANSRHAAVNITSLPPSLLLRPFSHFSVPWIKWRVETIAWKISFFRWQNHLIFHHRRAQGRTGKNCKCYLVWLLLCENRGTFFPSKIRVVHLAVWCSWRDWKTNGQGCWWCCTHRHVCIFLVFNTGGLIHLLSTVCVNLQL